MDQANKLLLDCLGLYGPEALPAMLQSFTGKDWAGIVQAALGYNLAPQLFHRLRPFCTAGVVPPQAQQRLQEAYYLSVARNMRLYKELIKILRSCNAAEVPVILLKGAHLAEMVYGNIALRPMGDLDLLVPHADLLRVHGLLVAQGYANAEKNMGNALGHLPPYIKKNAPAIEIHYSICSPPFSEKFSVSELWKRARPVALQGARALTLCPEDLLLHLCVHAAIDHGLEMGPLPFFDIARTLEHYRGEINFATLQRRAGQWGLGRCLNLMLCLSEKIAGLQLAEAGMPVAPSARELAAAEELVFEKGTPVASDIARLFGSESLAAKLRYCLRQMFPPPRTIKTVHPQAGDSLSLFAQYGHRIRGLFKKQGKITWRLLLRDKEMLNFAQIENRRNQLKDWIGDKS